MTSTDQFLLALTAWRENRGGGAVGMQSVMNVICNSALKSGVSPYRECTRPLRYSSITAHGDPELTLWPAEGDVQFSLAQTMAAQAALGDLKDITEGATNYYALTMKEPPYWAAEMTKTVVIEGQAFFK